MAQGDGAAGVHPTHAVALAEEQELIEILQVSALDPMQVGVYEKQLKEELGLMHAAATQASATGGEAFQAVEKGLAGVANHVAQLEALVATTAPACRAADSALAALHMSARRTFAQNQQVVSGGRAAGPATVCLARAARLRCAHLQLTRK